MKEEPHPHGSIKLKGSENTFRLRVGVYRIIYEVHNNELVVLIISISHRKDAYR
ncbi:MAG: type II toxin-antitoxin system RelE/ParE family toxin [Chitinophagaceae bacterium]|nr:type II toxin-antitoxin system RelE/ParE family toxin [Chitinophagaceae bacterium]